MDPRSEVIIRQQAMLNGKVLFVNAPQDQLIPSLLTSIQPHVWTWNYADYQYLSKQNIDCYFGIDYLAESFDQVVIFIPKAKELLSYILHVLVSQLTLGKHIFLVGEKKGGVESAAKQFHTYGKIIKIDSARHCQMWQGVIEQTIERKPTEAWLKSYEIHTTQGKPLTIYALPGVFSQNHLDVGTAVLLPFLAQVKTGKLADFGCGAGIISCYLASLHPDSQISAFDVDAFALHSTQLSFERNQLPKQQLHTQAVTHISDVDHDFDAIITNPPFHQGIHTDYNVSESLCQLAKQHLSEKGELWVVANRFLNYPNLIEKYFGHCVTKIDQNGFKVLYASIAGKR